MPLGRHRKTCSVAGIPSPPCSRSVPRSLATSSSWNRNTLRSGAVPSPFHCLDITLCVCVCVCVCVHIMVKVVLPYVCRMS